MRGSRNCCQRGSNFDNVFLVDERRDDQNTTNDRLTLYSGPVVCDFSGDPTSIAKKTIFL